MRDQMSLSSAEMEAGRIEVQWSARAARPDRCSGAELAGCCCQSPMYVEGIY